MSRALGDGRWAMGDESVETRARPHPDIGDLSPIERVHNVNGKNI